MSGTPLLDAYPWLLPVLAVVVLSLGALDIAGSLAVIRLHAVAIRKAPSGTGLLSWHVVCVASGNAAKVLGISLAMLDVLNVVESPFSLWLGLIVVGELLTLASLVIIGRGQRNRVRRGSDHRIRTDDRAELDDPEPTGRHHRARQGRVDTQPTPAQRPSPRRRSSR